MSKCIREMRKFIENFLKDLKMIFFKDFLYDYTQDVNIYIFMRYFLNFKILIL